MQRQEEEEEDNVDTTAQALTRIEVVSFKYPFCDTFRNNISPTVLIFVAHELCIYEKIINNLTSCIDKFEMRFSHCSII